MESAEYRIAPLPNPNVADTQHPTVLDYWPVCYDPDHPPASPDPATGFDGSAAGWGAAGGLREAAYLDEFGESGLKFSICQRDFAGTMTTIGQRLASMMEKTCIDAKLADVDPVTPGVQPECSVSWRYPVAEPSDPSQTIWQEGKSLVPCPEGASQGNVSQDCWRLVDDGARCPKNGKRLEALRTASEMASQPRLHAGTKLRAHCRVCPAAASGAPVIAGCEG